MTDLSILLVTRNAMPWVRDAVRQAAEVPRAQVVAVDAASTDGTAQLLRAQPGWQVLDQVSQGLASARNEALAAAEGEVIAFLDADDVWLEGKLQAQLAALADPEVDIVSCLMRRVGEQGSQTGAEQPALTPSGCLLRRDIVDTVGGFDPQYTLACDTDWFVRARTLGATMVVLPEVLLLKRIHDRNISHDRARYRRELAQVFRRGQ